MTLRPVNSLHEKDLHRLRQRLLDGAKDASLVVRGEGIILCNEPARALLRWPSVDMTEVHVRDLFSSTAFAALREAWDDAHRSGAPVEVRDVRVRRQDGEEEQADLILFPLSWHDDPTTLISLRSAVPPDQAMETLRRSESRFRAFIENSSDGIFQSSPDGRLLLVNPALVRMLGYGSAEELLRMNIGKDIYAVENERNVILQDLEASGSRSNVELRLKRKDGSVIVCLTSTRVVRRPSGEIDFYEGTIKDVTEWKKIQEDLRESQERYRAFIRQSTEGIWCFELDEPMSVSLPAEEQVERLMGRSFLKECNSRMVRMFGHEHSDEILGARMADLFDMADDKGRAMLSDFVRNGYTLADREAYLPGHDGRSGVYVSGNIVGIVENGHLLRAWGTQQDITARRQAERQLYEAQKMETLGTLAGGVAHDFNNILTIISGHLDLLTRDIHVGESGKRSIGAIGAAVRRGAGVVRQLMTFALEEQGTVSRIRVSALLREIEDFVRVTLPEQTHLVVSVADDMMDVMGDDTQLHQAVLNLVMNARDAMPGGGDIILTARVVDGADLRRSHPEADKQLYVCISVSDEGTGIREEARAHVFEPFFTTKDIGKGSGLGLAVVYGVVKGFGGFVDVLPNDARGSVFHLYLPGHEPEQVEHVPPVPEPPAGSGNETVLIVEDEQMLLDLLKLMLENSGYTVLTATDGIEAVEIYEARKDEIAIVLSDMGLPRLGGYEAFLRMKEINPRVKSILASGYMDPAMRTKLLEAGAMEFLQKPYVPAVILKNIREFIDTPSPTVT